MTARMRSTAASGGADRLRRTLKRFSSSLTQPTAGIIFIINILDLGSKSCSKMLKIQRKFRRLFNSRIINPGVSKYVSKFSLVLFCLGQPWTETPIPSRERASL